MIGTCSPMQDEMAHSSQERDRVREDEGGGTFQSAHLRKGGVVICGNVKDAFQEQFHDALYL